MSATDTNAAPEAIQPTGRRRGLVALCVTEITSWGILYYAFPVLLGAITIDTGWSTAAVMGAFSVGLGVSAIAGIPVGRLIDRYGPRPIMTFGSIVAVAAVAGIALAPSLWTFVAAWAVSGLAQACVFYKPAFAAITGWYGSDRVKALTTLTLVAGLASTVFAPVTAFLVERVDWRVTYLILGAILALVTVPVHALFLKVPWNPHPHDAGTAGPRASNRAIVVSPAFLVLVGVMTATTFALFAATVNLVPMLTDHGASTSFAAWALGLCGAGQLLGRIGYARLSARTSVRFRTVAVLAAAAVTVVLTAVTATEPVVLVAAAIAFGAARGVFTLLEATAVSDRWGTRGFGALYGAYSAPATIAMAATPWTGALLVTWLGGYQALFIAMAVVTAGAAIAALWTIPSAAKLRRERESGCHSPIRLLSMRDDDAPPHWTMADADKYANWFKALSDGTRIQIVSLLAKRREPMEVGAIVEAGGVGQSTVSHHLKVLADVGFVIMEPSGTKWNQVEHPPCTTSTHCA